MYIHERENWTQFRWNETLVNAKLNEVNKAAGYLAGRLSMIGFNEQMSAAVESVAHDVIASSEIEGVKLNTAEVRSSVARHLGVTLPFATDSSRYVDGVVEMALDATLNHASPLTQERLFGWHNLLFPTGWSGPTKIDVAQFRHGEMKVVSGMFGREKVHYVAPPADRIAEEMQLFLDWFNSKSEENYVKSAIAHFWFVCIHPFDDGNGRIGRAIADMALSKTENAGRRFFSISHQINKDKKQYYRILERSQKGDNNITEWLVWYLECLLRSIQQADELLSRVLGKAVFWQRNIDTCISDRQKEILNFYLDGYPGKLTVKNWATHAKVSPDTAARDIKDLVAKKILEPQSSRVRDLHYGIRCSDTILLTWTESGDGSSGGEK